MLSDSDDESVYQITINEHYAKAYAYKKEREELSKLKDKYGSDFEDDEDFSEDSESDESEDEDGEELTPAVDAAILRTLAKIHRKDPTIYDTSKPVFEEERNRKPANSLNSSRREKDKHRDSLNAKQSKPINIKQHALSSLINPGDDASVPQLPTHVEEQQALRSETISAFHTAVPEEEEEEGLLILRAQTADEAARAEEEYREFLTREVGSIDDLVWVDGGANGEGPTKSDSEEEQADAQQDQKTKKKKKKKRKSQKDVGKEPTEESAQEFLMNYILNRGWVDKSSRRLPTYTEITGHTNSKRPSHKGEKPEEPKESGDRSSQPAVQVEGANEEPEEDEDDFDDIADNFEASYNFRFEEPDANVISRFPREIPSLVRRTDTTRKEARERRKQRKEEELLKKKEEVKRLKALKLKEVRKKLAMVSEEAGLEDIEGLEGLDLEGDWDPEKHDRQMAELYNDDNFDPDEFAEQDLDGLAPEEGEAEWSSLTKSQKKRLKKKQKEAARMEAEDEFEAEGEEEEERELDAEDMQELDGMDFNDLIGDLPTRFKYATSEPVSYGLTPAEILLATDAELNSYMGLKKYAPYRKGKEKWDAKRMERLKEFKQAVTSRHWGVAAADKEGAPKKKRKGKKEREKAKAAGAGAEGAQGEGEGAGVSKKRALDEDEGDQNLEAEGERSKRKRKRKKTVANGSIS
ncbi:hypothetical protein BOTBODRAFT_44855 [Botryobasidium botryosum FD-172 SS1]|uniref:Kri1-like C-terminal domain-containing protein n=1 Tax=Botryobasidium botryosum (strain FD-172 SS1) TaxID=930990 RepID=A0A067MDT7_BOTB1|nr:hypothetical protein BOTBODRAFT_44855 [Botryobasidium botryosum FD-172 SS1]